MFKHYISLGWFCGTAAALAKMGGRGFSAPFDWCFSDFRGVIHLLDTDFEDFLKEDNLVVLEDGKRFFDSIHGIRYVHDIRKSFAGEIEEVREKYCKRIDRFRVAIEEGTCFFRAVCDASELEFIQREEAYINQVIKRYNKDNEIIYVIPNFLSIPNTKESTFFQLAIDGYFEAERTILYELFDSNKELITFCVDNIDSSRRKDNLLFNLEKENKRLVRIESNYKLMCKILKTNFNEIEFTDRVIIYGAGGVGKLLCDKIMDQCKVISFIDVNPKESNYRNIPINKSQGVEMEEDENISIIVTPVYSFEEIRETLKVVCPTKINIISLEEVLSN